MSFIPEFYPRITGNEMVGMGLEIGTFPDDLPRDPSKHYKKEWMSWNYFLGINLRLSGQSS